MPLYISKHAKPPSKSQNQQSKTKQVISFPQTLEHCTPISISPLAFPRTFSPQNHIIPAVDVKWLSHLDTNFFWGGEGGLRVVNHTFLSLFSFISFLNSRIAFSLSACLFFFSLSILIVHSLSAIPHASSLSSPAPSLLQSFLFPPLWLCLNQEKWAILGQVQLTSQLNPAQEHFQLYFSRSKLLSSLACIKGSATCLC